MHIISRKYSSLLEGLFNVTNSEKITSKIVNEVYTFCNVFKPSTYYLGNHLLKRHHTFLVLDTNGTYIITLKENSDVYKIYNLHDVIKYTISYISVKECISIVGESDSDTITLSNNKSELQFNWK